jgi:hypothetical protein
MLCFVWFILCGGSWEGREIERERKIDLINNFGVRGVSFVVQEAKEIAVECL